MLLILVCMLIHQTAAQTTCTSSIAASSIGLPHDPLSFFHIFHNLTVYIDPSTYAIRSAHLPCQLDDTSIPCGPGPCQLPLLHTHPPTPCTTLAPHTTWYLTTTLGRRLSNPFEDLELSLLPLFAAQQHWHIPAHDAVILLVNGTRIPGSFKHRALYDMVAAGGVFTIREYLDHHLGTPNSTCFVIPHAITFSSAYRLVVHTMPRPAPTDHTNIYGAFAAAALRNLNLTHILPDPCRPTILFANRKHQQTRQVLNREALLHAMAARWPGVVIRDEHMARYDVVGQARIVRSAHVFMFSHGAAGANVMFMAPGAVVIELLPLGFADPMVCVWMGGGG